jgi:hypothetical protein
MAMVAARLRMVWLVVATALGVAVSLGVGARADREPLAVAAVSPLAPSAPPAGADEAPAEIVHIAEPVDHLRSARDREVARIALAARASFPLVDRGWTEIHHRVAQVLHLDDGDDIAVVSSLGSHALIKATLVTAVVVRSGRVHSMVLLGYGEPSDGVDVLAVRGRHLMIVRTSEGGPIDLAYQSYFWEAPSGGFEPAGCIVTSYDNRNEGSTDRYVWRGHPRVARTGDLTVSYEVEVAEPRASHSKRPRTERFRFDGIHGYRGLDAASDVSRCHSWDDGMN